MPRFAVILPAAGKSSRYGDKVKKVFADLDGRPVWLRAVEAFVNRDDVVQTIVVVSPDDLDVFRTRYGAHLALLAIEVVAGGAERFHSVGNALARLSAEVDLVAIHDAARPCVTPVLIDAVFTAAANAGEALLAVPVSDTVKRADARTVVAETVPRAGLWLAQTPQVFRREWLVEAHARRAELGDITDDAQLVERAGHAVSLVTGSASNLKITTREDLALASAILKARPAPQATRSTHPFEDEAKW